MSSHSSDALIHIIESTLSDYKAFDVCTLDVSSFSTFTDKMVIASATSNRHARSLAEYCSQAVKNANYPVLSMQGESEGEWILVDFGHVILHVMQAKTRDFYQLEKFWSVDEYDSAQNH